MYSLGISNFVLKLRPMVDSASSSPNSSPLVSLTSLSFFIIKFLVWVSPTPTPRTKIFIDVPVDDAGSKSSGGISSGFSVAVQPKRGSSVFTCCSIHVVLFNRRGDLPFSHVVLFTSFTCFHTSFCLMLSPPSSSLLTPRIHSSILRFVFSLLSISLCSRSVSCSGVE